MKAYKQCLWYKMEFFQSESMLESRIRYFWRSNVAKKKLEKSTCTSTFFFPRFFVGHILILSINVMSNVVSGIFSFFQFSHWREYTYIYLHHICRLIFSLFWICLFLITLFFPALLFSRPIQLYCTMSQKYKINCRKNPSLTQPNRMHRYMSDFGRHTVQYVQFTSGTENRHILELLHLL